SRPPLRGARPGADGGGPASNLLTSAQVCADSLPGRAPRLRLLPERGSRLVPGERRLRLPLDRPLPVEQRLSEAAAQRRGGDAIGDQTGDPPTRDAVGEAEGDPRPAVTELTEAP